MIIKTRKEYYEQPMVLHNFVRQLRYKYLSARRTKKDGKSTVSRYYLGYSIDLLKQSLEKLNCKDQTTKLYFDVSIWKNDQGNTPMIVFDINKRQEDKSWFNKEYPKYFSGYDFVIDIDAEDLKKAYRDTSKIKKLFDEYKLPYSLKFSGGKGFHFLIEDKWFNKRMKAKNKVILFGRLAKIIMNVCKLKSISEKGTFDDSIYDDRRIFKLAYSLQNKKGVEYVCLPLSNEQFKNWKLEDMEMETVLRNVKLFKRGLLTRAHNLSEKELKINVAKFIKECR